VTLFGDSSALVKLYVPESGHEAIRRAAEPFVISNLARVEVPAAFWRKHHVGQLDRDDAALLSAAFEFDFLGDDQEAPRFAVVKVDDVILDDAVRLLPIHGLRAYDAVQLASALAAQRAVPGCDTVATFDRSLSRAAARQGLATLPGR